MFMLVNMDDIILTGSSNAPFDDLLSSLYEGFAIKDLGPLYHFLGIVVHSCCSQGILLM